MKTITINSALFNLKSQIGKMTKDSQNPFFKSKYFDINQLLEHVEPLAADCGLLILQPIIDGKVRTEIIFVETGEMKISELTLTENKDPQKVGSEITYFRRYTLGSLLGIQAVDDDGNLAVKPIKKEFTPSKEISTNKTLTQKDIEKWNGKIYKNNLVYIDNVPFNIPNEQIEKLKLLPNYKPESK